MAIYKQQNSFVKTLFLLHTAEPNFAFQGVHLSSIFLHIWYTFVQALLIWC